MSLVFLPTSYLLYCMCVCCLQLLVSGAGMAPGLAGFVFAFIPVFIGAIVVRLLRRQRMQLDSPDRGIGGTRAMGPSTEPHGYAWL